MDFIWYTYIALVAFVSLVCSVGIWYVYRIETYQQRRYELRRARRIARHNKAMVSLRRGLARG